MSAVWPSWRERLRAHAAQRIELPELSRAAVAMIVRPRGDDAEMLFIKRAEHERDPWSGHMAFPGGRVDATDEHALAAALRETCEEVDIPLEAKAELITHLDDLRAVARGRRLPLVISPFVFELHEAVTPRANAEVEEIHWVESAALRDPANWSSLPYDFEGKTYDLPCIRVAGRVIWGLTYRMLMSFFIALDWPMPSNARFPLDGESESAR